MESVQNLKELSFSDLIIGESGAAYLKGVPSRPEICVADTKYKEEIQNILYGLQEYKEKEFLYVHQGVQFRVARMQTLDGVWYTLRKGVQTLPSLKQLGMPQKVIEGILDISFTHGLLVFSGEMGSGKTTSASAYVGERLKVYGEHAIALEDPPELPLQGEHGSGICFQQEVRDGEFGPAIVRAMRYASPRIIFLGELRESHAVSEALRAAVNGHIIVATIHAAGIIETIDRIGALAKARDGKTATGLLASGLYGVVHQSLVRNSEKAQLKLQVLFAGKHSSSVRSKIREEQVHQLTTEIQAQQNKLFLGRGGAK